MIQKFDFIQFDKNSVNDEVHLLKMILANLANYSNYSVL